MTTILRADLAVTMDPELGVVADADVAFAGGSIVGVSSRTGGGAEGSAADRAGEAAATVVDLPGRWIIPGLVNAHTHAAMTLLRGFADDLPLRVWLEDRIWPVERHMNADLVRAGTLLAAVEMLAGGVTTFADMYLYMDGAADAVAATGARAVLALGLFAAHGPTRETLGNAADFVARWDGAADGRIRADLGPHAVYTCPPGFLRDIAEAAADLGVRTHMHLSETYSEVDDARVTYGRSPVEVAADTGILDVGCLAAHCVWVEDGDMRLLADSGAGVAHNPRSNMAHASGVAPVPDLRARGIPVGIGTDGAASSNQLTLFELVRLASDLQKVAREDPTALPAADALAMATIEGARALGLDADVGSLTPGKRADVVVLNVDRPGLQPVHDPLSTIARSVQDQDVERVYVDGIEVARDGRTLLVDPDDVVRDAAAAAQRLTHPSPP